jgi:hypothetical protein
LLAAFRKGLNAAAGISPLRAVFGERSMPHTGSDVMALTKIENDDLRWPHRDGLIWPHFSSVVVGLDVA